MDIYAQIKKHLSQIRIPTANHEVCVHECAYTYDTPSCSTGLYVSLTSFLSFGEEYVQRYAAKTGHVLFLHIKREKSCTNSDENESLVAEIKNMQKTLCRSTKSYSDGVGDNADSKIYEYILTSYSIVVMPDINKKLAYPARKLPSRLRETVDIIIAHYKSTIPSDFQLKAIPNAEFRQAFTVINSIPQLNNGKQVPNFGWTCEKCGLTNNVWINLTDGAVLCGHKHKNLYEGKNHAKKHFKRYGYPFIVRLNTISIGKNEVHSFIHNETVIDKELEQHLAHFNMDLEGISAFNAYMKQNMCGPGYTGLHNLGNTCYINSVVQVLFSVPEFVTAYVGAGAEKHFAKFPKQPNNDLNIQMCKLGNGLWSGKYSPNLLYENNMNPIGVAPVTFRNIVGKDHPDFSTNQQQDASEFYLHLMYLIDANSDENMNPTDAFKFCIEERIVCLTSGNTHYIQRNEYCLPLNIPLENKKKLSKRSHIKKQCRTPKQPEKITLQACLENFFAPEMIEHFFSAGLNDFTTVEKTQLLVTMPDYLMVQLQRLRLNSEWLPQKLNISVDMPDKLDMSQWYTTSYKDSAHTPLTPAATSTQKLEVNQDALNMLIQAGFALDASKLALNITGNNLDDAVNWLMTHKQEKSSDSLVLTESLPKYVNAENIASIVSMGFSEKCAKDALIANNGNISLAMDWIFAQESHEREELPTTSKSAALHATSAVKCDEDVDVGDSVDVSVGVDVDVGVGASVDADVGLNVGAAMYKLVAFITHIGTTSSSGHYIAHVYKGDKWIVFNDSDIAIAENPPKDLGYLYLYKREK